MVNERKEELHDELTSYLASRKKKRISLKKMFQFSPQLKPYKKEQKNLEEVAKEAEVVEAAEELEQEYEKKKISWLSKLLSSLKGKKQPEENVEPMVEDTTIDDMKTLAKISLKVIKMLPAAELNKFRNSEDFEKFKELLKKHSLIR